MSEEKPYYPEDIRAKHKCSSCNKLQATIASLREELTKAKHVRNVAHKEKQKELKKNHTLHCDNGILSGKVKTLTDELKAKDWISVEDGLPEEMENVFLFDGIGPHGGYYEGIHSRSKLPVFRDCNTGTVIMDITHWMPAQALTEPKVCEEKKPIVRICYDEDCDGNPCTGQCQPPNAKENE